MKKAPLKKVFEKSSDTLVDLGKASIIAGFASLFIPPVSWLFVIGGTCSWPAFNCNWTLFGLLR